MEADNTRAQTALGRRLRSEALPLLISTVVALAAAVYTATENRRLARAADRVSAALPGAATKAGVGTVVLLTEKDCSGRLQSVMDLEKRFRAGEDIVGGIVTAEDGDAVLHAIRTQLGVTFPLYTVSTVDAGAFLYATGLRTTPVMIQRGRNGRIQSLQTIEQPDDY